MSLRHHFKEELALLNKEILKMGLMAEEAMSKAIQSFKEKDFELSQLVIQGDEEINQMEKDLCDQCALLLAREQPVASDLRHILSAIKIISQLERIGDHAVHIAGRTQNIGEERYLKSSLENFPLMEELGRKMLIDSLNAFVDGNSSLAREVAKRDAEMDDLNEKVARKVLRKMQKNPENLEQGIELLFMSRYLERYGDHACNICEWVVYSTQGEHVDL